MRPSYTAGLRLAILVLAVAFSPMLLASDSDADGIQNNKDLDDDNDGILDEDEISCTASGHVSWLHDVIIGVLGNASVDVGISGSLSSTIDLSVGPGLTKLLSASEYLLSGATEVTLSAARSSDDYIEVGMTLAQDAYLYGSSLGIVSTLLGGAIAADYEFAAEISDDGFVSASVLYDNGLLSAPLLNLGASSIMPFSPYLMQSGITYTIRIYLYNEQNAYPTPGVVSFGDIQLLIGTGCISDADSDLIPNTLDIDSDNDGILDNIEAQSSSAYTPPDGQDTDLDGLDDAYDADNGGTPISLQNTDSTGAPDFLDTDSDEDGVLDAVEAHDVDGDGIADVLPASANADADSDGLNDNYDTVVAPALNNALGSNTNLPNSDGQDLPDWRDTDDDNDTALTVAEDANSNGNLQDDDADADGQPDYRESSINDADGDGVFDQLDSANTDPCVPSQFGNNCTIDSDSDGQPDSVEGAVADADLDGTPDYLESSQADADGDNVSDESDPANLDACLPSVFGNNCTTDTDSDGAPDSVEGPSADSDSDGLQNYLESSLIDADGDGTNDQEDASNLDACLPSLFGNNCTTDTDSDGVPDSVEGATADTDSDGVEDYLESALADADGDGVSDQADPDNSDACLPSVFGNNCLTDSDNDAIPDSVEGETADADADTVPDYLESSTVDTDGDGLNDQQDIANADACLPSTFGTNCTTDTDVDGTPDSLEGSLADEDSDGVLDYMESSTLDSDTDGVNDQADSANLDACIPSVFGNSCLTDTDADGTPDSVETATADNDADGLFDYLESSVTDTDGDGVADQSDSDNLDACVPSSFGNNCLTDTDSDGVPDSIEGELTDTDSDSIANFTESSITDTDNDGVVDQSDPDNLDPCLPSQFGFNCQIDTDTDGTPDSQEGAVTDSDGDTLLDYLESSVTDADSDGVSDQTDAANDDACEPSVFASPCTADGDADGVPDSVEGSTADADGDLLLDYQESSLTDADTDGVNDQDDPANADPCVPSLFGNSCTEDSDGDGVPDSVEGAVEDSDGDQTPDYLESSITDSDGDGVSDQEDIADTDACLPSTFGIGCTTDTDQDGTPDSEEGVLADTDNDGKPDFLESSLLDADNDGLADQLDAFDADACLPSAFVSSCSADTDADGISDYTESEFADTDNDGIPDFRDIDSDGDGVTDQVESNGSAGARDSDADTYPDHLDIDSDNDGIVDIIESQSVSDFRNPANRDTDSDGLDDAFDADHGGVAPAIANTDGLDAPDYLDDDSDNDSVPDAVEAFDLDGDGVAEITPAAGNADADRDGLNDAYDTVVLPGIDNSLGSNALLTNRDGQDVNDWRDSDDDNDGVLTIDEDTNQNGSLLDDDTDTDGQLDYAESSIADADDDGFEDQIDPANTDACVPSVFGRNCQLDSDGDGTPDSVEGATTDSDGDGLRDFEESSINDTDLDNTTDQLDPDHVDVCIPSTFGAGCGVDSDGDGVPDSIETETADFDQDGTPDYLDIDSDNDGVPDSVEGNLDTDRDGELNFLDLDSDNDGISDTIEAGREPASPRDTDGDGIMNMRDLDSDNDGLTDELEALGSLFNDDLVAGLFSDEGAEPQDFDRDRIPDYLDRDSDNDSISDLIETQGLAADINLDGVLDSFQDANGDGLDDAREQSPVQPQDLDGDGIPDFLDTDTDGDGTPDFVEAGGTIDNMADADLDGIPDRVDVDITGGIDRDSDGIDDSADVDYLTDSQDTDQDGIVDSRDPDADGDGFADSLKDQAGSWEAPDSNSNGVPDFQEANPAGLARTGLQGTGCSVSGPVTSRDPAFLIMLAIAFLFIRRRWQHPLKVTLPGILLLIATGLAVDPVQANESQDAKADATVTHYAQRSFYIGAGLGISQLEPDTQDLFNTQAEEGNGTGFQLFAGLDMYRWLSLEFHYTQLGAAEFANGAEISYRQYGASALLYLPQRHRRANQRSVNAFARVGYGSLNNSSSGDIDYEQVNAEHLLFGVGLEYSRRGKLAFRLEGYRFDEDMQYAQVSVLYRFRKMDDHGNSAEVSSLDLGGALPERGESPVSNAADTLLPPTDQDGDGVLDENDQCPGSPESAFVNELGCPLYKDRLKGVTFLSGSGVLEEQSKQILNTVASEMTANPRFRFLIAAHTDNVGDKDFNYRLSQLRAEAVSRYLVSRGVKQSHLVVIAHGEEIPLASNLTSEGRASNRRVEIEVIEVIK